MKKDNVQSLLHFNNNNRFKELFFRSSQQYQTKCPRHSPDRVLPSTLDPHMAGVALLRGLQSRDLLRA